MSFLATDGDLFSQITDGIVIKTDSKVNPIKLVNCFVDSNIMKIVSPHSTCELSNLLLFSEYQSPSSSNCHKVLFYNLNLSVINELGFPFELELARVKDILYDTQRRRVAYADTADLTEDWSRFGHVTNLLIGLV